MTKEKAAREIAEELFRWMPRWDNFDLAVHNIESILTRIKNMELGEEVVKYYDLTELRSSAKHYRDVLNRIIALLDNILDNIEVLEL